MKPTAIALNPLAAALAAVLALPVAAQNADIQTPDASAPTELETVEVRGERPNDTGYGAKRTRTATKTDTDLVNVPQSITVITRELIEDQAMQGVADVVRYVPGVGVAQGEGNRDTPIFRGNSSTADLFVDGMRDDVQYYRDLYNIERVEVLKGPNAMTFGRGSAGGLLNRVSRRADGHSHRVANLQLGSWDKHRITVDLGDSLGEHASLRINAVVEEADSYRDGVNYQRRGLNPTFSWTSRGRTQVGFGVEHFEEDRVADRGISSFQGRPVLTDVASFFGDQARSPVSAEVDAFTAHIEHDFANGLNLRNQTRWARYDKYYQNVYPGAVNSAGTAVSILAYNDASERRNVFNQTDLVWKLDRGAVLHTLLFGAEFGQQVTGNFRNTGYFTDVGPNTTSVSVPLSNPVYTGPIQFRQGASDADRHSVARVASVYAQDQIEFSPRWQALLGLRYDRFEVHLRNQRNGQKFASDDGLVSPRLGLIHKPVENLSLYASYSLGYLPRAGEQLGSLAASNAALEPEKFRNHEFGAKWDVRPDLAFTAAIYRLDRSNVAVVDPLDSTRLILLAGNSQRVSGLELGLSGKLTERWSLIGGYAWQDAEITRDIRSSATALIPKGTVLAQVPRHSFSLWNRVELSERWALGLGAIQRSSVYTSTSNAVILPAFTRFDGAVFFSVNGHLKLQLNIENLFDREYYAYAHSDTNITPGSPRAFNLGAMLTF